jgi:formate dehydrogenase
MQESRAHPGAGRRSARTTPKGRQLDPDARAEVLALLGDRSRRRDLLIEHLHLIQDAYGRISRAHIAALAAEMRLAQTEVFEVATFYAHFDVTDLPLPKLTIRVCDSISCALAGAEQLADAIAGGRDARVVRVPCVGRCDAAPVVEVGHNFIDNATPAAVRDAVARGDTHPHVPDYVGYQDYVAAGGYRTLERLRGGELSADAVLDILDRAQLRGLGGAGFPTGRKWRTVRGQPGAKLMTVNADEGEPGTFKDRWFFERDPHRFLEGMLIGAAIVEATDVFIYLRDEYPASREILQAEIAQLPTSGPAGARPQVHLRRGAGAYICGEESAMIESIEGKRGLPRNKPPFVFTHGLFGQPTLVNNVETLWWVRDLIERGPEWWNAQGRNGRKGLRSFSVSGRVREPGMKLAPAGITARQLIGEFCGGMAEGHAFHAYLPGGASGGVLPASMADIPLDFGTLEQHGCFIGSAAVVVFSDQDDLKAAALNLMRFFRHESCGQCTPCRVGTEKAAALMAQREWDRPLLEELSAAMRDASICGLGQAAPNPVLTLMRYFPEEFSA